MKDISLSEKKLKWLVLIGGMMIFLLHIPFLQADPDYHISWSRGPCTDEGQNTCQIRNLVNHNDLTLDKSDNFMKTPLFGLTLYIPFKIFGTYLMTGRLTMLILLLIISWYIFRYNLFYGLFGFISCALVFTEYHVFHFSHYCMAEILSTSLIFLGIFVIARTDKSKLNIADSFWGATFISLAWYVKFQFVYVIFILPLIIIIYYILYPPYRKNLIRQFALATAFLAMYALIFYLGWYLPNKKLFDYIMADQMIDKFVKWSALYDYIRYLKDNLFLKGYLRMYTLFMALLFIIGIFLIFRRRKSDFAFMFIGLSCWLLVEMHKFKLQYLPTRYLISFYFVMGLIMAVVLAELISIEGKSLFKILIKAAAIILIMAFVVKNASSYRQTLGARTFTISRINHYLAKYDLKDKILSGPWAPSMGWNSKAVTFPVWKGYFNDTSVFKSYHPAVILSEPDEQDSNQAYQLQGIDLNVMSDSVVSFKVNLWNINLYWIKPGIKRIPQ
jgi:hypothetical protein